MQFLTRDAKPSDLNLVRSSWLKSYRYEMSDMDADDYFRDQHARIERLLASSSVLIAHLEGAPDVIIGWLCCTSSVVHFAWTKLDWQNQLVFTTLLVAAGFAYHERVPCTHITRDGRRAVRRWRYLPYLDGAAVVPGVL